MTSIVVLGDSSAGKTAFMHRAICGRVPLNIFTSTAVETFEWTGALQSSANFYVVPGTYDDSQLAHALQGADALLVLYADDVHTARTWLCRASRAARGVHRVPIIMARTTKRSIAEPALASTLRAFPRAEHAAVTSTAGARDCINRILMRARRDSPSPLELCVTVQQRLWRQ